MNSKPSENINFVCAHIWQISWELSNRNCRRVAIVLNGQVVLLHFCSQFVFLRNVHWGAVCPPRPPGNPLPEQRVIWPFFCARELFWFGTPFCFLWNLELYVSNFWRQIKRKQVFKLWFPEILHENLPLLWSVDWLCWFFFMCVHPAGKAYSCYCWRFEWFQPPNTKCYPAVNKMHAAQNFVENSKFAVDTERRYRE